MPSTTALTPHTLVRKLTNQGRTGTPRAWIAYQERRVETSSRKSKQSYNAQRSIIKTHLEAQDDTMHGKPTGTAKLPLETLHLAYLAWI
jgi:hypothetical protein